VGIEYEGDKLEEILRLTKENNRMLHSMRRNAWLGGIFKLIMWGVLFVIPLWLYLQYLAPMMQSMLQTYQQIQGTSAQAQAQFGQMNQYLEQLKSLYGGRQ
jgi:uncharacterized oligopeptide transporter (OPT) family protein